MLYKPVDGKCLKPINSKYLYNSLILIAGNFMEKYHMDIKIELLNIHRMIINVKFNGDCYLYVVNCADYSTELTNNFTGEAIALAMASHDEMDIARFFMNLLYRDL